MKKFRPFWSYRIEKTNKWLEQLALQGQHLKKVNTVLRLFTFEEKPVQVKHYAIQYKENGIPTSLQNDGWTKVDKSISWLFLENGKESIKSYPVNDSLHGRLRLHLYMCYFFLFFFLPMQIGMFFLLSRGASFALLPLVIYGLLVILTTYLFIQHRKSEVQFVKKPKVSLNSRKAIRKIRPGWMYLPYQTKLWLNKMADQGYELHHVGATIFTFVEKRSECVAYEISFEKSVSKEYYVLHQDMGWQLKTIDGTGWFNYSIWMMPYRKMEEIPAFTYDPIEKAKSVRKTFTANFLLGALITLVVGQSAYRSMLNWAGGYGTNHYAWILQVLSILLFGLWLLLFMKIIIGFMKEMKQVKMN